MFGMGSKPSRELFPWYVVQLPSAEPPPGLDGVVGVVDAAHVFGAEPVERL